MPDYNIITARQSEHFWKLNNEMPRAEGPDFLQHDRVVERYWSHLDEAFPDNQFCLVDEASGQAVGVGNSIPIAFEANWAELPAEGLDWVLEKGFQDQAAGSQTTLMSALYIEVSGSERGKRLSSKMLATMRQIARSQGFSHLIAPVRPSMKSRYPLIPIEEYMRWQTPDGLPFDPWLRVHAQAGGQLLHPCRYAMAVRAPRQQWTEWTGMEFPGDGEYTIRHGLAPLHIGGDEGQYVEPGVWVVHAVG